MVFGSSLKHCSNAVFRLISIVDYFLRRLLGIDFAVLALDDVDALTAFFALDAQGALESFEVLAIKVTPP